MAIHLSRTSVPALLLSSGFLVFSACVADDPIIVPDSGSDADVGTDADAATDAPSDTSLDAVTDATVDATPDASDAALDTVPDVEQGPLAVIGDYDDGFGGFVRVTDTFVAYSWYGNDITVSAYDNAAGWLVGQNSPDDPWSPNLWSHIEWIAGDATVFWCQTEFGAETEEDALAAGGADREDLETGCAGFPWSRLLPGQGPLAIVGEWTDEWGGSHSISNEGWTQQYPDSAPIAFEISAWENLNEVVFAQNSDENEWSPGLWSRFDWVWDGGAVWYCQTIFDAETEEDARAAAAADSSAPMTGGCGGAPWTALSAAETEE